MEKIDMETRLMDDILTQLRIAHESMERQLNLINEAVEKSNNALLLVESHRNTINEFRESSSDNKAHYIYSKELHWTLIRIIENTVRRLMQLNDSASTDSIKTRIQVMNEEAESLESRIRILLALSDIVSRMRKIKESRM